MVKAIIIEDEPLARVKLESFIRRIPELELLASYSDARQALVEITDVDNLLVFLDIQMEAFTGIQFMEALKVSPRIIITSAYEEYALKGFEFNVSDYLLKPYSFDRFTKAVDKALRDIELDNLLAMSQPFMMIKTEYRTEKVFFSNILYVEGMKDYLRIHTIDGKFMILKSFTAIEQELPQDMFARIHKSYIVSLSKITTIEKDSVSIGDVRIPIGRSYKERFFEKVGKK